MENAAMSKLFRIELLQSAYRVDTYLMLDSMLEKN